MKKKCLALLLIPVLVMLLLPVSGNTAGAADLMQALEYTVQVDGNAVTAAVPVFAEGTDEETGDRAIRTEERELTLGVYQDSWDHKTYLSLRDLAALLNATSAQFDFYLDYEADRFVIQSGASYEIPAPVMVPVPEPELYEGDYYDRDGNIRNAQDEVIWTTQDERLLVRPESEYLDLYMNPLVKNGKEVRYYSYQLTSLEDLYMDVIDAQLLLGITILSTGSRSVQILTEQGFDVDLAFYEQDGFFDLFNGVVLGDATTGEILFGCKEDNPDAIASTSKLMTYMVIARYLELGRIHMDDVVVLSENVQRMAQDAYGTIWMYEGQETTVRDLLGAMLLVSSNEAALALAEYAAGTEEAFTALMNEMAALLGLTTARFYNSNGLPDYSGSLIASVRQNYMSTADLFRLICAIYQKYPQIEEFTAQKSMYLESFDYVAENTNFLLYNMENAIGLKTGTTDEAGCCLAGAVRTPGPDGDHVLVAIVIGALSNIDRYQIPEILLTWGMKKIADVPKASVTPEK